MASYSLFCLGNPLLDIQVTSDEVLKKYELKANDAILAEEKHLPIYEDLVKNHKVTYVAGGASQNAARGAASINGILTHPLQYVLPPKSVVYTGCVGKDELAEQLKAANKREGLDEVYQVKEGEKTGACAVVITGHHRSLVTTLRAAEKFDKSHLSSAAVAPLVEAAKVYYVEGYFLTHGTETVLELSQKSAAAGKLQQVLPYCDIIICNEAEAEAYATANGLPDPKDLPAIAKYIALLPKSNASKPRTVIFTQGAESTVYVTSTAPDSSKVVAVHALTDAEIVDTNGAGDAFAGGFLGAYVAGKELDGCVEIGHKLGSMCVQQVR
ncbi:adenosine kinase [Salix suchowensis]|nr:adenosine kinase [Salix suchowensis]